MIMSVAHDDILETNAVLIWNVARLAVQIIKF